MDRRIPIQTALSDCSAVRKAEWWEIRLPESLTGLSADELLERSVIPPKLIKKLMLQGGIEKKASVLRLRLFPQEEIDFPAEWSGLTVRYEDDFCLVVHKRAGSPVHPHQAGEQGTLAGEVAAYYELTGQACRVRHIHRLDVETTGLVLYAKCELAHALLDEAMREKRVSRIYMAVAEGRMMQSSGTIDKPIGRDRHHPQRRRVSPSGDPAVTRYEVLERFSRHSLVRLELETGRTHQIRVHMAAIGHPLAGDLLYGGRTDQIGRQALHGAILQFSHPWTGAWIQVEDDLPDDLSKLLERLRRQT